MSYGLLCPICYNDKSKVVDVRGNGLYVRRTRECTECSYRFSTQERYTYEWGT